MRQHLGLVVVVGLLLAAPAAEPLAAANKEHQQMMAEIRMLQQQNQRLQAQLAAVADLLTSVTARLEEQGAVTRKAFADQKSLADTMSADLRVVREKIDESNVRLGSIAEEVETLRAAPPAQAADPAAAAADAGAATRPGGFASPSTAFTAARNDYFMGQWSLAIQGFESYIKSFPKSDLTDDAQYYIGETYFVSGRFQEAVRAYDLVIDRYPASNTLADTYYKRGMALAALGQVPQAKESLSFVIKTFPTSDAALLAKQRLEALSLPKK